MRVLPPQPKKYPVFTTNTGIFLTFWAVLEQPIFAFWANFGPMGQKIAFLGHRPDLRAAFLCLLPEQYISDAFGCLGLVFLYDVAIKILCGIHTGMSKLIGYCHNICAICQ